MADERAALIERHFPDLSGDALIEEANRSGLAVATACALVAQETGGRNIFGADHGPTGDRPPYCNHPCTRERVRKLIRHIKAGGGSNGVSVCQLTYAPFIFEAEKLGGAHVARNSMRVGFRELARLIEKYGFQAGAAAYNAGERNRMAVYRTYGAEVVRRYEAWREAFTELGSPEGARPEPRKAKPRTKKGEKPRPTRKAPKYLQRIQRGEEFMAKRLGAHYPPWKPGTDEVGPPIWAGGPIPTREEMMRGGAICSSVPTLYRRVNNLELPPIEDVLTGGMLWWTLQCDHPDFRYTPGEFIEEGSLAIDPYRGPELPLQGHTYVFTSSGINPHTVQAVYRHGLTTKFRLSDMKRPTYVVPPSFWLT